MEKYLEVIKTIEKKDKYEKENLFLKELLYAKEKNMEVYYAPFDYINKSAKAMILGITPGWTQMNSAYVDFINNLSQMSIDDCFKRIKKVASFSGTMRKNLVNMLDEIHLNRYLKIESCASLFSKDNNLVQNASILRYPVFINGQNYTGSNPKMIKNNILYNMIRDIFINELQQLDDKLLIIPLGKAVTEALLYLIEVGLIEHRNILYNFPHPSGANGSRLKQFAHYKASFIETIYKLK